MDVIILVTVVTALFIVIGCAEPLASVLKLPYSVVLAGFGIFIGFGAPSVLRTELTDVLDPAAVAILGLPIQSDVFLYVFLPTLLFQATLGMALRRMLDDWVPILLLAIVAVVVTTLSIGYALAWASSLSLVACLLIGATVSTTDPSAVVSIFRSISAPARLVRIIEGESLLNDAAAIALFGLFMSFVMLDTADPKLLSALGQFPLLIAGGAATGWAAARIALLLMARFARFEHATVSISIALPYLAYITAEQGLGTSGVIAVVAAGATLNLSGPIRLSPAIWDQLKETWSLLAHWAGALIFILAALLIPRLLAGTRSDDLLLIAVLVIAALAARALILFALLPLLSFAGLSPKVERTFCIAIWWGGLRGAVTLALALAITESATVPVEVKRLVGILATGFVLFTMIVQGTTLRWVIRGLGLDRLSPIDHALSGQVIAVALQSVREKVTNTTLNYRLTKGIVSEESSRLDERLERAIDSSKQNMNILDRDRVKLGLIALANAERDTIAKRVRDRTLPRRLSAPAMADADRLYEAALTNGRVGYRRAARRSLSYRRAHPLAQWLHTKLHWSTPLARMTASRFGLIQSQRLVVRDLDRFIDDRVERLHGPRVASLLHDLLGHRRERLEIALEGLRLQFPGYAEELERRFLRRITLRLEEREYADMRDEGLVSTEIHAVLDQDLTKSRRAALVLPDLDIGAQRSNMEQHFPLFAALDAEAREELSQALETLYVDEGASIIEPGQMVNNVYFISTGAVELRADGAVSSLGPGDFFGQARVLSSRTARIGARAIASSTLLILDEQHFTRLVKTNPAVREAVKSGGMSRV